MTKDDNHLGLHFTGRGEEPDYPTDRIRKGLVLARGGRPLVEEGVGFGVPMFKFGRETVFPGEATFRTTSRDDRFTIRVTYTMNLVARMCLGTNPIKGKAFYQLHEGFSRWHREFPPCRIMMAETSRIIRRLSRLRDTFEEIGSMGSAEACYQFDADMASIHINFSFHRLPGGRCTEIIVANEQGAAHFDTYQDSDGHLLAGQAIGTWDEVFAEKASLMASRDRVAFTLSRMPGARMFCGRESVANRLAWSGLDYVLPGQATSFEYELGLRAG